MKKTVVVYQSKYGSTKKYAEWIAQALSCDLAERRHMTGEKLAQYDVIIYGGGLYAGGVSGINLIVKSFNRICNKDIIVFTCGLADTSNAENVEHIRKGMRSVFTEEMFAKIKLYHLRGGIDYGKLNILHKTMMAMLHKVMLKKDPASLSQEDKEMLASYGKEVDFTDKRAIEPIVSFVCGQ